MDEIKLEVQHDEQETLFKAVLEDDVEAEMLYQAELESKYGEQRELAD